MEKKQIALIGCGYWGRNHLRTLREMDNIGISYVCDSRELSLKLLGAIKHSKDYREILADSEVDGAIIATPTNTHYQVARDFLQAKKHVFVEKPITNNVDEAQELCGLAKENNVCLMIGEIFRFNPAIKFIKEQIDLGNLGELRYLESRRVGLGPIRTDVSALWDLATHDIYISNLITGQKPKSVSYQGISHNGKLDDISCINIKYESPKVLSTIYVNWEHPIKERMLIVGGTKKAIKFDDIQPSEKIHIFERAVDYLPITGDFGEFQSSIRSGSIMIPQIKVVQPLEEELKHFVKCMNKEEDCLSSGEQGLETVKVLEAAEESRKKKGLEIILK